MKIIRVVSYCRMKNGSVAVNGKRLNISANRDTSLWLSEIYRDRGFQYPKFYKMDNLCKTGYLAAELLLQKIPQTSESLKSDWAVSCVERCSSLDDDSRFLKTITDPLQYYPSPSVFVYTLANVLTGELCIRYQIGGESSCYIMDKMREDKFCDLLTLSFADKNVTHLLCGWVDYCDNQCDTLMMLLSNRTEEGVPFEASFVKSVY